jgi:hypothetical protein
MNTVMKVLLTNVAAAFGFTLLMMFFFGFYDLNDFFMEFGLVCLGVAGLDLLTALILFISGEHNHQVAKGFLLSAGVLFLLGFTSCGFTNLKLN